MAGVATRVLARLLDTIFQFMGAIGLAMLSAVLFVLPDFAVVILLSGGYFVLLFGYSVIFETIWGATPGKQIANLRIVTTQGRPPGFLASCIRSIVGYVEFIIVPFGFIPLVSVLVTRRGQRVGDLAAGTLVVRSQQTLSATVAPTPLTPTSFVVSPADTVRLRPAQHGLIRDWLRRSRELDGAADRAIGMELADAVAATIGKPITSTPGNYLASVSNAYRMRTGGAVAVAMASPPPPSGLAQPPPPTGPPRH